MRLPFLSRETGSRKHTDMFGSACGMRSFRAQEHISRACAYVRSSSPVSRTNKNRTFVYRQMFCFRLSKPQAWYIITT